MAGFLMREVMQEIKTIIIQPCSRALIVYYAIALSIISIFFTGAAFSLISPLTLIDMHFGVYILGIVCGFGILAIVVWIHLEMKTATYTELPGSHFVQMEHPQVVHAELLDLLDRVDRADRSRRPDRAGPLDPVGPVDRADPVDPVGPATMDA